MKKILVIALSGCLLNCYGMPIVSNPYFAENCDSGNQSQVLKPIETFETPSENQSQVLKPIETFETPSGIPLNSVMNYEEWKSQTEENKNQLDKIYAIFLLIRHVGDLDNLHQRTHTDSPNNVVSVETVGPTNALFLKNLGEIVNPDVIAAGSADRQIATARLIASGSDRRRYKVYPELNEQNLGPLGGKSMQKVLSDPDCVRMLSDPNYRINENTETGAETIKRFNNARDKLLFCALKARYKKLDLKIKVLDEIFANKERQENVKAIMNFISSNSTEVEPLIANLLEDPIRIMTVSSRSIMNWKFKYEMGDMNLPLQLTPNCYTYCSKVWLSNNKCKFLKTKAEYGNQPYSLSPINLISFILNYQGLDSAPQKFAKDTERIIVCKKKAKKVGSNTVSRSNSFSESISDSVNLINDNISYLERSLISRSNSKRKYN